MNGETIKEYLVGLGFGVDDGDLQKFNKAIQSAGVRVASLYAGVQAMAAGIFYGISQVSESFEQMGYEARIVAPAINNALMLRNAMLDAYARAGVNIVKVVQESVKFNYSLAKTKFAFDALYKGTAARFIPQLTKQMDIFREKIYANMPRIQAGLEKFVKFVFKAFEATIILGQRIWSMLERAYDFFVKLDKATDGWSTIIIGLIAAWKLFNLAFLATPLGMVLAGLLAILAVYDDFKTAQEGGESFFNWNDGPMRKILDVFTELYHVLEGVFGLMKGITDNDFSEMGEGVMKVVRAFWALNGAIDSLLSSFHVGWIDKLLAWRDNVDSGVSAGLANSATVGQGQIFGTAPLGSQGGAGVNQSQQNNTTVNVNTADPNAAASQVVGAQKNVNADASRNMKARAR